MIKTNQLYAQLSDIPDSPIRLISSITEQINPVEEKIVSSPDLADTYQQKFKSETKKLYLHDENPSIEASNKEEIKEQIELNIIYENMQDRLTNGQQSRQIPEVESIGIASQNIVQDSSEQPAHNLPCLTQSEVKIYLAKVIGFLLTLISIWIILVLKIQFEISYSGLFIVLQTYLVYIFLVEFFWTRNLLRSLWVDSESNEQVFDAITWSISLGIFYLSFIKVINLGFFACIPFMVLATTSAILSETESDHKFSTNSNRFMYFFHIFIITSKIDDYGQLEWPYFFIIPWAYLVANSRFCFKHGLSLIKLFNSIFIKREQLLNSENKIKIIGFFWSTILYGLNLVAVSALIGIAQAYSTNSNKSFKLLNITAYVGSGICTMLFLYTIFFRNQLIQFIISIEMIRSYYARSAEVEDSTKGIIHFHTEKKDNHFVMVSPTYFLPLKQTSNIKDEENLNIMKTMLLNLRRTKLNSRIISLNSKRDESNPSSALSYHKLKQHKALLDKKLSKILNIEWKSLRIKKDNKSPRIVNISAIDDSLKEGSIYKSEQIKSDNLCLTFDNRDSANFLRERITLSTVNEQKPLNLCYICCINQSNAILVSCGHGGICCNCAFTLIKKKNECMECRKNVEGIYKINTTPVFPSIFKGVELNKIVSQK